MKRFLKAISAIMLTAATLFAAGCKPEDDPNNNENNNNSDVSVTTYTPQEITYTSAKCGGDVIVAQGLSLNELGVCWGHEAMPTVEDEHLSTSDWNNPFICTLSGLNPGTVYHVRAYALRGLQYYYGEDKSFTTITNTDHGFVDLGLPSGTLWATCNVGANTPEESGYYFAWGETETKNTYSWNNYKHSPWAVVSAARSIPLRRCCHPPHKIHHFLKHSPLPRRKHSFRVLSAPKAVFRILKKHFCQKSPAVFICQPAF